MKSDIINIDNRGNGFEDALAQTMQMAQFKELSHKEALQLRLCTEEMLSLARSVTGEMQAAFWLECQGKSFDLHMSTKTVMDKEKRYLLLSSSSSRKNEAAKSFLGRLRDKLEEAMAAEVDHSYYEIPDLLAGDIPGSFVEDTEWDRYEKSILRSIADNVKIAIRGGVVDLTVSKSFE